MLECLWSLGRIYVVVTAASPQAVDVTSIRGGFCCCVLRRFFSVISRAFQRQLVKRYGDDEIMIPREHEINDIAVFEVLPSTSAVGYGVLHPEVDHFARSLVIQYVVACT